MRVSGSVLGGLGWEEVVGMVLYGLFVGLLLGDVRVCSGVVWACVCGMCIWWGCAVSMLLMRGV